MSRYIARAAIRGANRIVKEADDLLQKSLEELGPETAAKFVNTGYYLPVISAFTGDEVEKLGDLVPVIERAKGLLHPVPDGDVWLPYLGETLDCGVATILAEEAIEGIRHAHGEQPEPIPGLTLSGCDAPDDSGYANGPIGDEQFRSWGIQMVDGTMPGFAAIVGAAKTNEAAVSIVRELQKRGLLVFLCGNVNGVSIIDQLMEEGVEMGYNVNLIPLGRDTISAIYALGYATRSALTFGGLKSGQTREILLFNKYRTFAFVLALGEVDDLKYASAAGAISYGFPTIADTVIPQILPTGVTTYEHVISMPFDDIEGETDAEKARRLVERCVEVRGVRVKVTEVDIPVAYGSAFAGEIVRRADMRLEFGGKYSRAFEYLRMRDMDEVEDHKIEVIGDSFEDVEMGGSMNVGIVVEVAGRQMQEDLEPVLERNIHDFINSASGLQHIGQRDIAWLRISKSAAEKGFKLEHFGEIIWAALHEDFGAIVDKVQVKIISGTAKDEWEKWLEIARETYQIRDERLSGMKDEDVDTFYSCILCQSFAPNHVCVVSPERIGLCGAYSWLDCKACFRINPRGPNQPIKKGECLDPVTGYFTGVDKYAEDASHGTVGRVSMYSAIENPMTSCGCFECIMVFIPEANGFMTVSREDPNMTPCGMTFSSLAGVAGGGIQTPGVMGHGKRYMLSKKFIAADGGFKRMVWMSKFLKDTMHDELQEVCERIGKPDLLDNIADHTIATTPEELVVFMEEKGHPALDMPPLF